MRVMTVGCMECDAKANMYSMEHDGRGNAAAAFACTNNLCRATFVFSWRYVRAGTKGGRRKIDCINSEAVSVAGAGIGRAGLPCPECGEVSYVKGKTRAHKEMFTAYHVCPSCGFHFSSRLEYSHMITISALRVNEGIRHLLGVMTPEQLKGLAKASGNAALLPKS
ncbi:hypothetical protein F6G21_21640 [Salmonella enterica]|nr:hypothetical protein [Salmonella enterica]ECH1932521.1 hypothetical protein [Salmonella enterica]ECX5257808.1 hypothetical protein [Salmonella enterica]EKZ2352217.1 hypothetical protein [Salmonella enterica]OSG62505.1 hypothetical protein R549_24025 [Salmonella enterica subsp. enterica serovar Saphra]